MASFLWGDDGASEMRELLISNETGPARLGGGVSSNFKAAPAIPRGSHQDIFFNCCFIFVTAIPTNSTNTINTIG